MHVGRVLPQRGRGEAEHAAGIGAAMRQTAVDEPVEHPVQRHPIKRHVAQPGLDLGVRQRRRRLAQQAQDAYACGRGTGASAPDLFGNGLLPRMDWRGQSAFLGGRVGD